MKIIDLNKLEGAGALKEAGFRAPLQFYHGLSQLMKKQNLSVAEAFKMLHQRKALILLGESAYNPETSMLTLSANDPNAN